MADVNNNDFIFLRSSIICLENANFTNYRKISRWLTSIGWIVHFPALGNTFSFTINRFIVALS